MERLIEEVRKHPVLWNTSLEVYRNAVLRSRAWAEIAMVLNRDKNVVKEEWRRLRDSHRQAMFRRRTKSGQPARPFKSWKYEKNLSFLMQTMPGKTRDNCIPQEDQSLSCDNEDFEDHPSAQNLLNIVKQEDITNINFTEVTLDSPPEVSPLPEPRSTEEVLNYFQDKTPARERSSAPDDLDLFFASACQAARRLHRSLQNQIKRDVLDVIIRAEEQQD